MIIVFFGLNFGPIVLPIKKPKLDAALYPMARKIMNKIIIVGLIIGIIIVGIAAGTGINLDESTPTSEEIPSDVTFVEDESGTKHFTASMSDNVGITDTPPP